MGNSESTCSPHEDDCKEAETKLRECARAHLTIMLEVIGNKTLEEGYKAAFDADDDKYEEYMERGPCKESYMAYVESTDKDSDDKHMAMMECMETHSDYYDKFLDFYKGGPEKALKEFESVVPLLSNGEVDPIRAQAFYGHCCKQEYSDFMNCFVKNNLAEVLSNKLVINRDD
ncbi:hypothetical protein Bca52824_090693 [Brassica carinata]|uniref:GCK domain-containing protein n=1 Tax=Brassica carinata TaxID=52824 RepID=A0A8X7NWB3_BRACI|nr:hypothetical protein Bca52824_090693 [Brassica carinata]